MKNSFLNTFHTVQTQTVAAIADGTEEALFPTLTRVMGDTIEVAVMMDCSETSTDMLTAIERFGYATGRRKGIPDFVFFAAESVAPDGKEQIMLSGCSKELEVVLSYLDFQRSGDRKILPTEWSEIGWVEKEVEIRIPALRAMRGAISKAHAPWWK